MTNNFTTAGDSEDLVIEDEDECECECACCQDPQECATWHRHAVRRHRVTPEVQS